MSKYINIIVNDRAYSLPLKYPAANLDFDRALTVCRNKGAGWHLTTNAFWAAVAMWCKKNGSMPHGNNNYGEDYAHTYEKGVPTYKGGDGAIYRTATGSDPASWYHNHNMTGIADLNGNVWEWVSGLRLNNGEVQIIPYGNAMKSDCNMSETSTEWKAIKADGTLVNPGTAGTLKFDYANNKITLSTALTGQLDASRNTNFENIALASDVTIPNILKALGLYPDGTGYDGDNIWINNSGERLPRRGGSWVSSASAGVFTLTLNYPRSDIGTGVGFRSAFCE